MNLKQKLSAAELLRARISPSDCLSKLAEVEGIVQQDWSILRKNQIDALRLQADIQFRKLQKILPDLKSTALTVGDSDSKVQFIIRREADKSLPGVKNGLRFEKTK